jgi:hypothetical protein
MTHLARPRTGQFIDLLGELTEADPRPEPGYRQRPKPDWLSEFADEDSAATDDFELPDPPLRIQLEPERSTPRTTGRRSLAVPMAFLAAVSAAIALIPVITRHGDLPEVRGPAVAVATPSRIASAPLLAQVPRASGTGDVDADAPHLGASTRQQRPEPESAPLRPARDPGPSSVLMSGSTPHEIETAAVQDVLDSYRASLATSSTAGIEFHSCGVELSAGGRATARCTGRATFVPKAGRRSARVEPRAWSFSLSRVNDQWIIVSAESR